MSAYRVFVSYFQSAGITAKSQSHRAQKLIKECKLHLIRSVTNANMKIDSVCVIHSARPSPKRNITEQLQ